MKTHFSLSRRHICMGLTALGISSIMPATATAQKPEIFSNNGVAIRGYDPVAYFVAGEPQKGSQSFETTYKGTIWRFVNAENLSRFTSEPEKYAPQYGGYCAWAVSLGYTASIHPDAWSIENDKLYLNYSKSVRRQWLRDKENRIILADGNWPAVLDR